MQNLASATLPLAIRSLMARASYPGTTSLARDTTDRDAGGFRSFGEYLSAVVTSLSQNGKPMDGRLANYYSAIPTTKGSESSGVDGSFVVPVQFVNEVVSKVFSNQSLLMKCDVRTLRTNGIVIPKDETTPWQPNSGVTVRWASEGSDLGALQSKLILSGVAMRTHKIVAFVPVTDEVANDSTALAEHVSAVAPAKIQFAVEQAIISGSGVGKPLGIINSTGTVTVAKESGQANGTILHQNIVKLWTALVPAARQSAIWLAHPDSDLQLMSMTFPGLTATTGAGAPAYQPPSENAPFGSLLGRPIFYSEACSPVGTPGDIILADMNAYLAAVSTLNYTPSVHLWFDMDMMALRFVLRVDGQPWTNKLFPSLVGGASRGFFAMLAQR